MRYCKKEVYEQYELSESLYQQQSSITVDERKTAKVHEVNRNW